MTQVLHAEVRKSGGAHSLRQSGKLPGVVYGPGAKEGSIPVACDPKEFEKVFRAAGESEVVRLAGVPGVEEVLVHEVQYDPVTDEPLHIDLYAIAADQEVEVEVPLIFEGEAPAEKLGGVLTKVRHSLAVAALPRLLPHELVVDVSSLCTFDDKILAQDISLPEGTRLVTPPDEVVALVVEQTPEEEETPAEIDMSTIEVEKKGKKQEESASGEEASE